jgi:hypothetical protein
LAAAVVTFSRRLPFVKFQSIEDLFSHGTLIIWAVRLVGLNGLRLLGFTKEPSLKQQQITPNVNPKLNSAE